MSYEIRIGLLATICIAVTIWGYKFMKGKNLLKASNSYYVEYTNVDELAETSPVLIRGLRVGSVSEIRLSRDMQTVIATLDINRGIRFPRSTEALVISTSLMGGKAVVLSVTKACTDDCAEPGTYLKGRVQGVFESILGKSDVEDIQTRIGDIVGTIADSLTSDQASSAIAHSFQDIQAILRNLASITSQLNHSMSAYDSKLLGVLTNLESTTKILADSITGVAAAISNLNELTEEFKTAKIGSRAADAIASVDAVADSLQETITNAGQTLEQLTMLLEDINAGKGTLGKLTQDDELYTRLSSTLNNLDRLLQDFRLNPKRYVNVSVFGKKQKDYVLPENDPADPNKQE